MDESPAPDERDLYDRDFGRWVDVQAAHLRKGRHHLLDTAHLIEEIESLGKSQLFTLRSSYALIAMHLLKHIKQPEKASASWDNTINRERGNIVELLDDNPGLKPKREEAFAKAYAKARSDAAFETKLPLRSFPIDPPFTLQDVESKTWWPPEVGRSSSAAATD